MKRLSNFLYASLLLTFAVNMVGCSDGRLKTEPVRGIITLDGVPLAGAAVSFGPKESGHGAAGFARTNEKGEYLLQTIAGHPDAGTLPGEYIVTISKYKSIPTGRKVIDSDTREQVDEMSSVLIFPGMTRYTNADTTPFSATVVKGKNRFDFDVKSE